MRQPATIPNPYDWHHRPDGGARADAATPCPICGAFVTGHGSHRILPTAAPGDYQWLRRYKRCGLVVVRPFGSRSAAAEQGAFAQADPKAVPRKNSFFRAFYRFMETALVKTSRRTRKLYQTAAVQFCNYVGRDVTVSEISEAMIGRFHQWILSQGRCADVARKYAAAIRAVARPKGLLPSGDSADSQDAVLDMEGSLYRFFKEVYLPEQMVGCAPGSIEQMLVSIRRLCQWAGHTVLLAELSDGIIARWMGSFLDAGLSRETANGKRGAVVSLWRLAYHSGMVDRLPRVRKIKTFRRLPTAWTLDEMSRLLQACGEVPGVVGPFQARDWWSALVLLLFDTGLRIRAALDVERDALNLDTRWITVAAEVQKQRVEQAFLLTGQTMEAVARIWLPERRLLFPWRLNLKEIWPAFKRILTTAGLPDSRRDLFHKLRRTTASWIAAVGGIDQASRQLGHSGTYMTARYIDPRVARAQLDGALLLPRPVANQPSPMAALQYAPTPAE